MSGPEQFDLTLSSGVLHAARWGPADGPLTLCVHGLSANWNAFGYLAEQLATGGRRVVALDLRGRGRSDITPPGSYGLVAHAEDALEAATALGADRFDYVGWSLGALIGITATGRAPRRVRTLSLIDHSDREDGAAQDAVRAALNRLDAVVDDPDDYVARIREAGAVTPWSAWWDAVYAYELHRVDGRYTPRTDKAACAEDLDHPDRAGVRAAWAKITMPALLVRATVPLGGGDVVPVADRDALLAAVPGVRVVELDRNHFGVMTDPRTADAIDALIGAGQGVDQGVDQGVG
jgi:pimeloyl-ACP methyl ester carboxylesterase